MDEESRSIQHAKFKDHMDDVLPEELADLARAEQIVETATTSRFGPGVYETQREQSIKEKGHLFGAGGYLDGVTALMGTGKDIQVEDEITMQSMGERTIDEVKHKRNLANTNEEFNYSQYKFGRYSEGTMYDGTAEYKYPGNVEFTYTTTDGVSAGDTALEIDPSGNDMDVVAAAMGVIGGQIWSEKDDTQYQDKSTESVGNPFQEKKTVYPVDGSDNNESLYKKPEQGMMTVEEEEQATAGDGTGTQEEGKIRSYPKRRMRLDKYEPWQQVSINQDEQTGLRRINIRKHQSDLLTNVTEQARLIESMSAINEAQAKAMQLLNPDDRKAIKERIRYPGHKYTTNQVGLTGLSHKQYKDRRSKNKHGESSKLTLTGVGI
jgi:hypothetical protein